MTDEQIIAMRQMQLVISSLEIAATDLRGESQKLCDHKRPNGNWAVICPFGSSGYFCEYCDLDDCYIDGYKKP